MLRSRLLSVALFALLTITAAPAILRLARADDPPASPAPKADDTVSAKRYATRVVVEGGRASIWIEELYFPEQGVCANVQPSFEAKGDTWDFIPMLNAFRGPIRTTFRIEAFDAKEVESPAHDIRVPAALAKQIFEAAELTRRLNQQRRDAGSRVAGLGLCRDLDEHGAVRAPPAPASAK